MITVKINSNPFDGKQRLSSLMSEIIRELLRNRGMSCTIQFDLGEGSTMKFRVTLVGASRRDAKPRAAQDDA